VLSAGEFFVVGIAASAGGLESISEVLKRLPARVSLAIVIVQHLDPHHESILVDLLGRVTPLPVAWATHGHSIEAGHVYVAPPRSLLAVKEGILLLEELEPAKALRAADHFLQSLAEDFKHRAVGVILSGNATDGTAGTKAIKGMGGIVMAQDPAHAAFPSMPRSAIDAGCVDRALTPPGIAEELLKLAQHAPVLWSRIAVIDDAPPSGSEAANLMTIFRLLAVRTGVDFGDYKQSTIKRRFARQIMLA
jgi:two-component system CheB/CheR fusion protein